MTIKRIAAIALCSMALGTLNCNAKSKKEPAIKFAKVDTFNYAIGNSFAQGLLEQLERMDLDSKDIKKEIIIQAFADALNGKTAIDQAAMGKAADEYMQARFAEKQKAVNEAYNYLAKTYEKQGFVDLGKPVDPRLADYNGPTVRMMLIKEGTGEHIAPSDFIYMDYEGKLAANDTIFDTTDGREPALLAPNQVIPGFAQAVCQLKKGSKAIFLIPSALAYGEHETGPIPANSALVFTIDVKEVFKTQEEAQAFIEKQNGTK